MLFFAVVFGGHWAIAGHNGRKRLLLVASYAFYAAWDYRFLALILASTAIDYFVGLGLSRTSAIKGRKLLLAVSVSANLGFLGVFKYADFFAQSFDQLLATLGFSPLVGRFDIILPVGISFFTFQTMSYTIDVYREKIFPTRDFLDFAFFVSFFPQLVAGPIVRAIEFFPQMANKKWFRDVEVRAALSLFLIGFIKKACIADNLAVPVDEVFGAPDQYDVASIWVAVLCYSVQIYCDFSGYTDMAIAVAALLGYKLPVNFYWPYFASNVQDFWRRWHITLSTWLRDYLYISLGGNRGSRLFTYRNILITMLLGGLWHGAAWTFVVWGALHGIALVIHREVSGRLPKIQGLPAQAVSTVATFYFVCVAWIFFRAEGFADAMTVLRGFVLFDAAGAASVRSINEFTVVLAGLALVHYAAFKGILRVPEAVPDWLYAFMYGLAVAMVLPWIPLEYRPFIYFQF